MSDLKDAIGQLDLEGWLISNISTEIKDAGGSERRIQVCPKCKDDRFKLYVNIHKKTWICFVCDWGRNKCSIVEFLSSLSGKSKTQIYLELLQTVIPANKGNITKELLDIFDKPQDLDISIPEAKEIDVPGTANWAALHTHQVLRYAYSRGLTPDAVSYLKLRCSQTLPTNKGYELPGPWLVFPIFFGNKSVSWQGRRVGTNKDPKYCGNTNIKEWLWPISDWFFKLYKNRQVILTEGVFDALGYLTLGMPALCTFGKSISTKQLQLLQELQPQEVVFSWDLDAHKSTIDTITRVSYMFPKTSLVIFDNLNNTEVKIDAGDALTNSEVKEYLQEAFQNRLNTSSPEFFKYKITKSLGG